MRRKQIFVPGLKKKTTTQGSWLFIFALLSSPLFSLFLPHFFFFCWAFIGFNLVGKVSGKALTILGSDERKGRWVSEQDFQGNFRAPVSGQCYMVFLPFCPASLTESCSLHSGMVWKISFNVMSANLKVSGHDVTSHRRDVDPHGRLRDEWVYTITLNLLFFNVLGHAGRDTPSLDSIWRMRGSLSLKRSLLDRFRPGGYFSDAP